jgi:hypothetical protein
MAHEPQFLQNFKLDIGLVSLYLNEVCDMEIILSLIAHSRMINPFQKIAKNEIWDS